MKTLKTMIVILILMVSTSAHSETLIKKGATSQLIDIYVTSSASNNPIAGLTGLVYNTASLTCYYYRSSAVSSTAISLVTMTAGTWASGGFKVIDGTNMPGLYQIGIPDAALLTGAEYVDIYCRGATNMNESMKTIILVDNIDSDTYTRIGALGVGLTDVKILDAEEKRLGWVATIDLTGNAGTFVLSLNAEGVSVTNQFKGMKLICGNESREIVASASGSPDTITTEPFNPWPSAPTSSTCVVRN